jgi:hypothetical protein
MITDPSCRPATAPLPAAHLPVPRPAPHGVRHPVPPPVLRHALPPVLLPLLPGRTA